MGDGETHPRSERGADGSEGAPARSQQPHRSTRWLHDAFGWTCPRNRRLGEL